MQYVIKTSRSTFIVQPPLKIQQDHSSHFNWHRCNALVPLRGRCCRKSNHHLAVTRCPYPWMRQALPLGHKWPFVFKEYKVSNRKEGKTGPNAHGVDPPFSVGSQTCAFCPAHHLQQLVPNVILIPAWIERGRWRARRLGWARRTTSTVARDPTARAGCRCGCIGLIVHHSSL